MSTFVYRGVKAISAAAGVPWKRFDYFRREKGLPAWQYEGKGLWLALPEDLVEWVKKMRDENLRRNEP